MLRLRLSKVHRANGKTTAPAVEIFCVLSKSFEVTRIVIIART